MLSVILSDIAGSAKQTKSRLTGFLSLLGLLSLSVIFKETMLHKARIKARHIVIEEKTWQSLCKHSKDLCQTRAG